MNALFYLFCFSILVGLASCKKIDLASGNDNFSFKYNGRTYDDLNEVTRDVYMTVITFEVQGSNSTINLKTRQVNCSFMSPNDEAIISDNCILSSSSGPIDSSKVYFYRSGFVKYSYSDCLHFKIPDLVFGGTLNEYDACTVTGNFELTFANNKNQTISITKGAFTFNGVHR